MHACVLSCWLELGVCTTKLVERVQASSRGKFEMDGRQLNYACFESGSAIVAES